MFALDEAKRTNKKAQKLAKKLQKEIIADLDVTDKSQMNALSYFVAVNKQFDDILSALEILDERTQPKS